MVSVNPLHRPKLVDPGLLHCYYCSYGIPMLKSTVHSLRLQLGALVLSAAPLAAQRGGVEFGYGHWWHDSATVAYSISYFRHLLGPASYSLGLMHLREDYGTRERQTGGVVAVNLFREGRGPYVTASAALLMGHDDGSLDGQWSAGAGYAINPVSFLSLGLEAAYRVEDRAIRGFWRLDPADRRGFVVMGRVALGFGGGSAGRRGSGTRVEPTRVSSPAAGAAEGTRTGVGPAEVVSLRTQVVTTALEAMGTPYRWGGNDSNGFDCSGLIQYAYEAHGLLLPRVSRDQARSGVAVALRVRELVPGDILGFSDGGGTVTHVGLYVGDGEFIHSASGGVRVTSLTAGDGDSRWWRQRWVSASRIIN